MSKCKHCGRGRSYELRGFIAVLVLVLAFGLAYSQLFIGSPNPTLVPPWVGVLVGSVTSMYFMSRSGERMREMTTQMLNKPQDDKERII